MAKGESPLKQFEIQPLVELNLFGQNISFTNSSLWMTITTVFILAFFTIPFLKSKKTNSVDDLYPSRLQVAAEMGFSFINNLITDTAGKKLILKSDNGNSVTLGTQQFLEAFALSPEKEVNIAGNNWIDKLTSDNNAITIKEYLDIYKDDFYSVPGYGFNYETLVFKCIGFVFLKDLTSENENLAIYIPRFYNNYPEFRRKINSGKIVTTDIISDLLESGLKEGSNCYFA